MVAAARTAACVAAEKTTACLISSSSIVGPYACQVLGDRPEHGDRHEHQQPENDDHGPEREAEGRGVGAQGAGCIGGGGLGRERRRQRERRDDRDVAAESSITRPVDMFQKRVLSPRPSKPDPLLAADEVNS